MAVSGEGTFLNYFFDFRCSCGPVGQANARRAPGACGRCREGRGGGPPLVNIVLDKTLANISTYSRVRTCRVTS